MFNVKIITKPMFLFNGLVGPDRTGQVEGGAVPANQPELLILEGVTNRILTFFL